MISSVYYCWWRIHIFFIYIFRHVNSFFHLFRHVANGEILGVSLLMEDVLMSGQQDKAIYTAEQEEDETTETESVKGSRPVSAASEIVRKSKGMKNCKEKLLLFLKR